MNNLYEEGMMLSNELDNILHEKITSMHVISNEELNQMITELENLSGELMANFDNDLEDDDSNPFLDELIKMLDEER